MVQSVTDSAQLAAVGKVEKKKLRSWEGEKVRKWD
jgi:hypothetical protein